MPAGETAGYGGNLDYESDTRILLGEVQRFWGERPLFEEIHAESEYRRGRDDESEQKKRKFAEFGIPILISESGKNVEVDNSHD